MSILEKINYWLDIVDEEFNCFKSKEKVKLLFNNIYLAGLLKFYELPQSKGIVVYIIGDDFKGNDCVSELFTYIKKEHRGNIRMFKQLISHLEQVAKENDCISVRISSNIGYNDDSVIKCLCRWGYSPNGVIKEIK